MTGEGTDTEAATPKRSTGLWVGAGLGVLVTIAVLFATLASGGPEDPTGSADVSTPAASLTTSTTSPLQAVASDLGNLPDGDYAEFCQVLDAAVGPAGGDLTPERFTEVITRVDFAALVESAPEGIRPQVELLRDSRDTLVALMGTVESFDDLTLADFPEGVPLAIVTIGQVDTQKCT